MALGKLLLTGATGFVGAHLRSELEARGIPHFAFSRAEYDLTDTRQTRAVFQAHRDAEAIVHLACYQAAADFPAKHTGEQFHVNGLIHLNVLEAWREFLPQAKLVAIGSSVRYPNLEGPITEDRVQEGQIHGSVYSYAFTKRLLCSGIRAYNDQYKLDGSYLIPATMFGEHDDFHVDTAHVSGALIGKFVAAAIEDKPAVEIWGDGTQVRDFMDVKEFVRVLLELIPRLKREVLNVGPGQGTSIRELATKICAAAEFKGQMIFKPTGYVGVQTKVIDVGKLNNQYQCRINPDHAAGLRRTATWYRENYARLHGRRKFDGAQAFAG